MKSQPLWDESYLSREGKRLISLWILLLVAQYCLSQIGKITTMYKMFTEFLLGYRVMVLTSSNQA